MDISYFILIIITSVVFVILAFSSVYIFTFSIAGLLYHDPEIKNDKKHRIAVLIPGYKEDNVILDVASISLEQNYPHDLYDVIVIADSFNPDTLEKLRELPLKLIEVSFDKSTKSKALNKAFEILPDIYDLAIILDADNIMEGDFLEKVSHSFSDQTQVLQGHRIAKNLNTNFAVLDAVSEEVNNHIFRKGHRVVNLSAALIGSAMVFRYSLLKEYMKRIKAIGGFDKELEMNLLRDGIKIDYLNKALVYDEKISHSDNFKGQRKRWLAAQFIYFGRFAKSGITELITKGNIDFFDKVLQMILIPRVLLLGVLFLLNLILLPIKLFGNQSWFYHTLFPGYYLWLSLLITVSVAILMAIPGRLYSLRTLKALLSLPKGFLLMFLTILNLKGANKKFIHTKHG